MVPQSESRLSLTESKIKICTIKRLIILRQIDNGSAFLLSLGTKMACIRMKLVLNALPVVPVTYL